MSTFRHSLLLAATSALASSCAVRAEVGRATPTCVVDLPRFHNEAARVFAAAARVFPAASPVQPSTINPYAPTRARDADMYTWQTANRAECTPDSTPRAQVGEPGMARSLMAAIPDMTREPAARAQSVSPDFVIAGLRPALHQCYPRWLESRLDAQGSVRFALQLGCAGDVEEISADNQGVDGAALECLFSVVAPARFAPPAGGHATVFMPVVFKNAAR